MSTKLLVTGATGYIGGDALYAIVQAHPEYEVAAFVRNSDKGARIATQYAKIRLVYGSLDSASLLEEEAKKADIVLNFANADHPGAVEAILKGLAAHPATRPGYFIHTSGTGILIHDDMKTNTYGEANEKVYDDWEGIKESTLHPDWAPHRNVEKLVIQGGTDHSSTVKTAIVCPPAIYGKGRGPDKQRSYQLYELARGTLVKKYGIQVGAGKTFWSSVNVSDLSDLYLKLVEAAVAGGGTATWGSEGYYYAENGEIVWGDIAKQVAVAAYKQGLIPSDDVVVMPNKDIDELVPYGSLSWGANSRTRAVRARKLLGWVPKGRSMQDEVSDAVKSEAQRLGLVERHAAKVVS